MCLAIYKPATSCLKKEEMEEAFSCNGDGAGFAVQTEGIMEIRKGFFTFQDFWKAFEPEQNLQALVHFRQATHGLIDEPNCHPWPILGGTVTVIHNGIINIQSSKTMSDTARATSPRRSR